MTAYSGNTAYAHNTVLNPSYAATQMASQVRLDAMAGLKYSPVSDKTYTADTAMDRRFTFKELTDAVQSSTRAVLEEKTLNHRVSLYATHEEREPTTLRRAA